MSNKIPVILHHCDYRGDHAADIRDVVMLKPDTTLSELVALTKKYSHYGKAWIEVGAQLEEPDGV